MTAISERNAGLPFVITVIVTYRRVSSLQRAVEAVLGQTRRPEGVLVIDNDDQASEALQDVAGVEIVSAGGNLGPAGGYALGIEAALARGATRIWFVDDDSEPDPHCLERLLVHAGEHGVVVPRQIRPNGRTGFPRSWAGTLIRSEVVEKVGLPDASLFFSKEDSEYFWRAYDAGYRWKKVGDAVVIHHHEARVSKRHHRGWRLYYQVRNHLEFWLRRRPLSLRGVRSAFRVMFGMPIAILIYDSRRVDALRLWWWAVRDFSRGRLGKTIDPEDWN